MRVAKDCFLVSYYLHCAILHLGNVVKACPVLLTVSSMQNNVTLGAVRNETLRFS